MTQKKMSLAVLARKLANPKQLRRITAPSLDSYRKTLKYPKSCRGWRSREIHMATRLVQAGLSREMTYRTFMYFAIGLNTRRQQNRVAYFNEIYSEAVADANFTKNLRAVIVKSIRYQI
ncbi:hypothetical protein [Cohnella sp. GbtcB17]|uniref:hypothetical protein n=1 Tax=Cohnella sp. GbtcB17 TaxID=2824762 RepID=UPI001C2F514F|nr:hypothetical protein [Cohnella sp. GbtcB17]